MEFNTQHENWLFFRVYREQDAANGQNGCLLQQCIVGCVRRIHSRACSSPRWQLACSAHTCRQCTFSVTPTHRCRARTLAHIVFRRCLRCCTVRYYDYESASTSDGSNECGWWTTTLGYALFAFARPLSEYSRNLYWYDMKRDR